MKELYNLFFWIVVLFSCCCVTFAQGKWNIFNDCLLKKKLKHFKEAANFLSQSVSLILLTNHSTQRGKKKTLVLLDSRLLKVNYIVRSCHLLNVSDYRHIVDIEYRGLNLKFAHIRLIISLLICFNKTK